MARLAVVLTVLQLGSRHVPRNSITMETLENWRKTEVRKDGHGTVVHTASSSIAPSKFLHAASGIVDNTSAILYLNEDYSFLACMHTRSVVKYRRSFDISECASHGQLCNPG